MKELYEAPQVLVLEMELEGAVTNVSGEDLGIGGY